MYSGNSLISIGLVFFPALLNISLLIYLLAKFPRNATINIFALFLIAMIFWQVEEVILRFKLNIEDVRRVDQILSVGWMAVGPLFFHFTVLYTKVEFARTRFFYFLTYGTYLFFYISYHSNPVPTEFIYHEFWGFFPSVREASLDMAHRVWIAAMVFLGIAFMYRYAGRKDVEQSYRNQTKLILTGVSLPAVFGLYSHILLPMFSIPDIPLTATLMTAIPIATVISLSRYNLFNYFENLIVEDLLVKLDVIIMLINSSYKIIYMNPLAKRLFGREEKHRDFLSLDTILGQKSGESEAKGQSLTELLPFQQNIKGLRLDLLSNKEETVPVLLSTQVIKNNFYSNHTMLLGYDLSEINRYEEELRVFNEKYNLLLKATNEAVFDVDVKTGLLNWGGGYQAFFGHFPANLPHTVGKFCHRIHKDDLERFQSIVSRMEKKEKNVLNLEYRLQSDDGGYLYVLQRSYVVFDPAGNPIRIVGALKDVTQEKEHLRELTRKNEKLKEIAWIQSHEVRRPLSNILGLIDMLSMDSCISVKEKKVLFEALKKSGIELDRIIHRIVEKSTNLKGE